MTLESLKKEFSAELSAHVSGHNESFEKAVTADLQKLHHKVDNLQSEWTALKKSVLPELTDAIVSGVANLQTDELRRQRKKLDAAVANFGGPLVEAITHILDKHTASASDNTKAAMSELQHDITAAVKDNLNRLTEEASSYIQNAQKEWTTHVTHAANTIIGDQKKWFDNGVQRIADAAAALCKFHLCYTLNH